MALVLTMQPGNQEAMNQENDLKYQYLLRLGDNALILGQRLGEWCGHGPVLEQDIAMTNIALDLIGQARLWLTYAGEVEGKGQNEDDLAFKRDAGDFCNVLLVEQPNGDFAHTIVRQFLFDASNFVLHEALCASKDEGIKAIAEKSIKEIAYHRKYSSEWTIRLGDGTAESHRRMQQALDDLWMYHSELLAPDALDQAMAASGTGVNLETLQPKAGQYIRAILAEATLEIPANNWMQSGGKQGRHSEHLGFILADMQFMQRAYPGMTW